MKSIILSIAAAFAAAAAAGEKAYLWPEGKMPDAQPHQYAAMTDVSLAKGFKPDEWRAPYIEWFEPEPGVERNGLCAILISGGSYECTCDVSHIAAWKKKLTAMGAVCANLVYRTPRPKGLPIYKTAWEDGQRAVRLVRADAAKRGFDPEKIGTFSMSAGSHLALLLATSSQTPAYAPVDGTDALPCHINFACPFAAAYVLTDGLGHPNTREGDSPDVALDGVFKFDAKTCPVCMMHGGKDPYSPLASTRVYRRLREMKIPAEVHIYPDKGHGVFGFDRAVEFLRQTGFLPLEKETDIMKRLPDDSARAGGAPRTDIWPEGKTPDFRANQCKPYIQWHMPKEQKTKAFAIIFSGGAYNANSPEWFEVAPARRYLNEKGMAVATLRYRTPRPEGLAKHLSAWQDLQRTIRIARREAPSRGLDPDRIAIMGSSAGGHLALMGALDSRSKSYLPIDKTDGISAKVQLAVAIYPAYALTDGINGYNTTGGNSDEARLAPEFAFDPDTPPVLFIHGDADKWAAMNSVKTWEQLRRMGVQGELHTLALRDHGFQRSASPGTGSYTWMDRIWEFMSAKGFNK